MTEAELKVLAKLLEPYRSQVEALWTGSKLRPTTKGATRLLTIPQTADALGVKSTDTVYALIASGALRAVDIAASGKQTRTRIREDDLAALIDARTRRAQDRPKGSSGRTDWGRGEVAR